MKEPILKYPDPHEEYILYTDASKYAWAGVLTQEYQYDKDSGKININHPITYVSGKFCSNIIQQLETGKLSGGNQGIHII